MLFCKDGRRQKEKNLAFPTFYRVKFCLITKGKVVENILWT